MSFHSTSGLSALAMPVALGVIASLVAAWPAPAQPKAVDKAAILKDATQEAQKQMQMTFSNLKVEAFRPSPISGLYEADIGGRMVYYQPKPTELLLFGTIFNASGTNLTAQALDTSLRSKLSKVDVSTALVVGTGKGPSVIEFTNPDCSYCRALDTWWKSKRAEGKDYQRKIIFAIGPGFKDAAKKAEHILCSPKPDVALQQIYGGAEPSSYLRCDHGRKTLESHAQSAIAAGVNGTPTVVAGSTIISGYRVADLEVFLNSKLEKPYAQNTRTSQ